MNTELLIRGGRVVDPSLGLDAIRDIRIQAGRVERIGENISSHGLNIFDASGMIVLTGLIDMHTHLREPGAEEAETIWSGCEAAARIGDGDWRVELRIPFAGLRLSQSVSPDWAFNICREKKTKPAALSCWAPPMIAGFHHPELFGTITGLKANFRDHFIAFSTLDERVRPKRYYFQQGEKGFRVEAIYEHDAWRNDTMVRVPTWRIGHAATFEEAMAPHNLTFTMVGASLLWVGWFGFNAGSALEAGDSAALAFATTCLLYTSPSPRDRTRSRMPSSA